MDPSHPPSSQAPDLTTCNLKLPIPLPASGHTPSLVCPQKSLLISQSQLTLPFSPGLLSQPTPPQTQPGTPLSFYSTSYIPRVACVSKGFLTAVALSAPSIKLLACRPLFWEPDSVPVFLQVRTFKFHSLAPN